jgi:hypothetical protein
VLVLLLKVVVVVVLLLLLLLLLKGLPLLLLLPLPPPPPPLSLSTDPFLPSNGHMLLVRAAFWAFKLSSFAASIASYCSTVMANSSGFSLAAARNCSDVVEGSRASASSDI